MPGSGPTRMGADGDAGLRGHLGDCGAVDGGRDRAADAVARMDLGGDGRGAADRARLMPLGEAGQAVAKGTDVYLFLIGMMLLSETAREHGAFDWIAATAVNMAGRSRAKLFALVYATGVIVTTFMSNDATAVVLTPAVFVAAKKAKADPLPLLFACALIANAASFVLPISNRRTSSSMAGTCRRWAHGWRRSRCPRWRRSSSPSRCCAFTQRARIAGECESDVTRDPLSTAAAGDAGYRADRAAAARRVGAGHRAGPAVPHWRNRDGGHRIAAGGALAADAGQVGQLGRAAAGRGLFVLVEALDRTGVIAWVAQGLRDMLADPTRAAAVSGTTLAFVSNAMNNLPAGLVASSAIAQAHPPQIVTMRC